ncbi:unnamed protein product [Linum trigynum]|uniref:Uncharacterized protein n=1 Tax=Linum trigynum TaxID=586398 RepID=A0AAV2EWY5_9ROSI
METSSSEKVKKYKDLPMLPPLPDSLSILVHALNVPISFSQRKETNKGAGSSRHDAGSWVEVWGAGLEAMAEERRRCAGEAPIDVSGRRRRFGTTDERWRRVSSCFATSLDSTKGKGGIRFIPNLQKS